MASLTVDDLIERTHRVDVEMYVAIKKKYPTATRCELYPIERIVTSWAERMLTIAKYPRTFIECPSDSNAGGVPASIYVELASTPEKSSNVEYDHSTDFAEYVREYLAIHKLLHGLIGVPRQHGEHHVLTTGRW